MKFIKLKCDNKDCGNNYLETYLDLGNYVMVEEYFDGWNPATLFYRLPENIICQECFNKINVQIIDA